MDDLLAIVALRISELLTSLVILWWAIFIAWPRLERARCLSVLTQTKGLMLGEGRTLEYRDINDIRELVSMDRILCDVPTRGFTDNAVALFIPDGISNIYRRYRDENSKAERVKRTPLSAFVGNYVFARGYARPLNTSYAVLSAEDRTGADRAVGRAILSAVPIFLIGAWISKILGAFAGWMARPTSEAGDTSVAGTPI